MRPTNRKFTSMSSRIESSSGLWTGRLTPAISAAIGERPHVVAELLVDRQRIELRLMAHRPEQCAHPACAIADGVSLVRRRHPLVDDHPPAFTPAPAALCKSRADTAGAPPAAAPC